MKLVVDNPASEVEHRKAKDDIGRALRRLTANLLRITRGAGKPAPAQLVKDLADVNRAIDAFFACRSEDECLTPQDISDMLCQGVPSGPDVYDKGEDQIICGSLQVVASRLIRQPTQEAAGRHEMWRGQTQWEALRARNRKNI